MTAVVSAVLVVACVVSARRVGVARASRHTAPAHGSSRAPAVPCRRSTCHERLTPVLRWAHDGGVRSTSTRRGRCGSIVLIVGSGALLVVAGPGAAALLAGALVGQSHGRRRDVAGVAAEDGSAAACPVRSTRSPVRSDPAGRWSRRSQTRPTRPRARSATTSSRLPPRTEPECRSPMRWRDGEAPDRSPACASPRSALELGLAAGGAHARAIDGVAATLRDNLAITAEVRAQAAQAQASAARHRSRADRVHRARVPGRPSHRDVPVPDAGGSRMPRGRARSRRGRRDLDGPHHPDTANERRVLPGAWARSCSSRGHGDRAPRRVALERSPSRGDGRAPRPPSSPRPASSAARSAARLGRRPDRDADGRLGVALFVGVLFLPFVPLLAPAAGAAAWSFGVWRSRQRRRAESDRVRRTLPEVVDLFVVGIGAGSERPARAPDDRAAVPGAVRRRAASDRRRDRPRCAHGRRARGTADPTRRDRAPALERADRVRALRRAAHGVARAPGRRGATRSAASRRSRRASCPREAPLPLGVLQPARARAPQRGAAHRRRTAGSSHMREKT